MSFTLCPQCLEHCLVHSWPWITIRHKWLALLPRLRPPKGAEWVCSGRERGRREGGVWDRLEGTRYLRCGVFRSWHQQMGHLETRAEGEGFLSHTLVAAALRPQLL